LLYPAEFATLHYRKSLGKESMKPQLDPHLELNTASARRKRLLIYAAIAGALFVLCFMRLGNYPLMDADEPNYGRFAVEMAAGGDWLTPHYFGAPWFDKPPLFYWESAASVKLLGPNELACRLPSALLAVGLLALVYLLASHDFGRRAGILSAVVMGTCIQQIVLAHAAVTDMTFAFCLTASLYAYRRWFDAGGGARVGWMALCGGMMGLAMLAKGPVAIVLLGATFIIQLAWERRLGRLIGPDVLVGVLTLVVVGFPWYIAMLRLHHDAFVQGFLEQNNITRFLKPEHASQTGAWYSHLLNMPVLFGMFFPWSLFVVPAVRANWRASVGGRLLLVWFAVVFVFFSLSKTILVTYIFPSYPACAIFVGAFLALAASNYSMVVRTVGRAMWVGLAFCSILMAVTLTKGAHSRYPEAVPAALALLGILALTMTCALFAVRRSKSSGPEMAAWIIGGGMTVFTAFLMIGGIPLIAERVSARNLVSHVPPDIQAELMHYSLNRPSIAFYLGRPVEDGKDATLVRQRLMSNRPVLVFVKPGDLNQIEVPGTFEWARCGEVVIVGNRAAASLKRGGTR